MYNIKFQVYNIAPIWITAMSWQRGLCNSVSMSHAQGHPRQTGHSGEFLQNVVSAGVENDKPFQYTYCKNPINYIKR